MTRYFVVLTAIIIVVLLALIDKSTAKWWFIAALGLIGIAAIATIAFESYRIEKQLQKTENINTVSKTDEIQAARDTISFLNAAISWFGVAFVVISILFYFTAWLPVKEIENRLDEKIKIGVDNYVKEIRYKMIDDALSLLESKEPIHRKYGVKLVGEFRGEPMRLDQIQRAFYIVRTASDNGIRSTLAHNLQHRNEQGVTEGFKDMFISNKNEPMKGMIGTATEHLINAISVSDFEELLPKCEDPNNAYRALLNYVPNTTKWLDYLNSEKLTTVGIKGLKRDEGIQLFKDVRGLIQTIRDQGDSLAVQKYQETNLYNTLNTSIQPYPEEKDRRPKKIAPRPL